MTLQGGDRAYPNGDAITVRNNSGSSISAGELVTVTGVDGDHPTVSVADANGAGAHNAVAKSDAADGELLAVQLRGTPWTRVDSGVSAGAELATPDSSLTGESEGVGISGGSTGDIVLDDAQEIVSGSGEYFAPVALD